MSLTNNDIINAKIEGIILCLHYLQHKKDVRQLIDDLIDQKDKFHAENDQILFNEIIG